MSKREVKVAWSKEHPWNLVLAEHLRAGRPVDFAELLGAVEDPDRRKVFDPRAVVPLHKHAHVILQHSVLLQRPDGTVAVFERAAREEGQDRITTGFSVLLSESTPDDPFHALPRLLTHQLCVGHRRPIGPLQPMGLALNRLRPGKNGQPKPHYLIALYRHEFPQDLPLHGRFRDTPDTLVDWRPKAELPRLLARSGYVDQLAARCLDADPPASLDEGDSGLLFHRSSHLSIPNKAPDRFEALEYSSGHSVFISHCSEDSFAAFALYRFLMDESSRSVLATIDLEHLREGENLSKIERLIRDADGLLLLITPNLLAKSAAHAKAGTKDWVRHEVDLARAHKKPILGFKLGTLDRPDYLPADLITNDRSPYVDWLQEVQTLISRIRTRFGMP